ncbi:MAG: hypothetical protein M0C28_42000 [Candidatus Moduliflexus flocculans]|nr:hypothetical protein [Candidatus Moduliflexus flocculans]
MGGGDGPAVSGVPSAAGQTAAADKDLLKLLPRSTVVVMVLDIKRLLEIDAIAKAVEGPEFKKFYGEFVQMSGIDPKKDVAYVGWGIPSAAIAAQLSMPTSPVPLKDMAMVVGLEVDNTRVQGLVKDNVPEAEQEAYNGVTVFNLIDEATAAAAAAGHSGRNGDDVAPARLPR